MKWRKWNNILHRDLGYIAFGLTIIYAVSGIFLNHKADLNPNYVINKTRFELSRDEVKDQLNSATIQSVLRSRGLGTDYTGIFRPEPDKIQIFYQDKNITLDLKEYVGEVETIKNRKIVKEMNFLHLNTPKRAWTYIADIYAVILILLAFSGLFVLKGKKGIKGRGAWLTVIGLLIPVIFVIIYS